MLGTSLIPGVNVIAHRLGPIGVVGRFAAGGALLWGGIQASQKDRNTLSVLMLSTGAVSLLEGLAGYCPVQDAIQSNLSQHED